VWRQRETAAALGAERVQILELLLGFDLPWREHARRRGLRYDATARAAMRSTR
jgi:hypothetical protein